jgi:hypothetical protein
VTVSQRREKASCRTKGRDGQGGPFDLTRTGDKWTGSGIIGNRRVWFELGQ